MPSTIFIDKARVDAFKAKRVRSEIIKTRKILPQPGEVITIKQGGWGKNRGPTITTAVCTAIRAVVRVKDKHWAYGHISNRMTLSNLDLRNLASECGFESADALDKKFASIKPEDQLWKVVFA